MIVIINIINSSSLFLVLLMTLSSVLVVLSQSKQYKDHFLAHQYYLQHVIKHAN